MKKKGQLTIFIIVAIVAVGMVILFYAFKGDLFESKLSPEAQRVYNFVQNCIEEEAIEIIYQIGEKGGYFFPPELSTDSGIPYYYYGGKNYMPSKEHIEDEISKSINNNLPSCTKGLENFTDLNIDQGDLQTDTKINNDKIVLNINYPTRIIKDSTIIVEDFKTEIPLRIGVVYNSISDFVQEQSNEGVCLSCILEISEENNLNVEIIDDYGDNIFIFVFRDESITVNGGFFELVFANKY